MSIHLILYSKSGCHLCEGLQEKLAQIQSFDLHLEVRDITARDDWFQAYQYEIPVLILVRGEARGERRQKSEVRGQESGEAERERGTGEEGAIATPSVVPSSLILHPSSFIPLPRPSPRATVQQLEQVLRKYL